MSVLNRLKPESDTHKLCHLLGVPARLDKEEDEEKTRTRLTSGRLFLAGLYAIKT
jgi:hypothetical protein